MSKKPAKIKRRFTVTVTGLDDVPTSVISDYIREAVQAWGGQWSSQYGEDERWRISKSLPTVKSAP